MFLKKISKNIAVALTLVMVSGPALNTVSATNGKVGYIYEEELLGEAPKSPEEAIMIQESRSADDLRMISVYDKDAKTIIGQFCIER